MSNIPDILRQFDESCQCFRVAQIEQQVHRFDSLPSQWSFFIRFTCGWHIQDVVANQTLLQTFLQMLAANFRIEFGNWRFDESVTEKWSTKSRRKTTTDQLTRNNCTRGTYKPARATPRLLFPVNFALQSPGVQLSIDRIWNRKQNWMDAVYPQSLPSAGIQWSVSIRPVFGYFLPPPIERQLQTERIPWPFSIHRRHIRCLFCVHRNAQVSHELDCNRNWPLLIVLYCFVEMLIGLTVGFRLAGTWPRSCPQ